MHGSTPIHRAGRQCTHYLMTGTGRTTSIAWPRDEHCWLDSEPFGAGIANATRREGEPTQPSSASSGMENPGRRQT